MLPLLFKGKDERKLVKVQEGWLQPFETEGWLQLDPKGDWIYNGEHLWHHSYTRPAKGTSRQK